MSTEYIISLTDLNILVKRPTNFLGSRPT